MIEVRDTQAAAHGLRLADIEFWQAGGKEIKPPDVFLWMDKYCTANPESSGYTGAVVLINERTNNAWYRKFGIQ